MKNLNLNANRQNILNNTADATAMRLFVLLVFLLLSCSGVFGQNAKAEAGVLITATENISVLAQEVAADETSTSTQMELVIWFMGAKQTAPVGETAKSTTATTAKKKLINCGMTPNRILSRTILKKAMQYDNSVA